MRIKWRRPGGGLVALLSGLVLLLALAVWGLFAAWELGRGSPMSVHGWIAMALAAVLRGGLAAGLIALAFYSARHGYDDDQRPGD